MQYRLLVAIYSIALVVCLQGCSTIYRYDTTGNLTCVDVGVLSPSTFAVPPPIISISGDTFGCPRVVTVDIAAPNSISSVRFTRDGSAPTAASPPFAQPFSAPLQNKYNPLIVQAITVDQCGAVSQVAKQQVNCVGDILRTPVITHWFDLPIPWPGKKPYDDVVFERTELPQGCTVTGIQIELINPDGSVFGYAGPESDEATDGHTGASLKSYSPLPSSRLELKVNSWHLFGYAVRYDVVYFVRGTNCVMPPFKYRTQ